MPFIVLVAEITLVYLFIQSFGFLNFFLFYAVTMGLGILIVTKVGAKSLREFQNGQVTTANQSLISRGLLFIAGLLLIVPSMGTKFFGVILILPPTRWLLSIAFTGFLLKRVFGSNSFIHQFGNRGFSFHFQSQGQNPFSSRNEDIQNEKDPDVIEAEFKKIEDDPKLLK